MKKFLLKKARVLTALMLAASLALGASAATVSQEKVTVETDSGRFEKVNVTSTTETTQNADGSKTVVKNTAAESYKTGAGYTVKYTGSSNMTTDLNNITTGTAQTEYSSVNRARTYAAIGGSSSVIGEKAPDAEIDIPLTDEDDASTPKDETKEEASGPAAGSTESEGDIKAGAADGEYDYTVDTVQKPGGVRVTTTSVVTKDTFVKSEGVRKHFYSDAKPTADNDLLIDTKCNAVIPANKEDLPKPADGYEYIYIGGGNSSQYWAAYWYTSKNPDYLEEEPFLTDVFGRSYYLRQSHAVGKRYHVEGAYLYGKLALPITAANPAVYSSIYHFTMAHPETGSYASTYCADLTTHAITGYSYNVHNLEETDHYTVESANKIRAIAMKGYWGTKDDPATSQKEFGSLEAMKEMMRAAVDPDTGKPVFTEDDMAALTDGVAMTATQYAIWAQSNAMNEVEFINTHLISKNEEFKNSQSTKTLGDIPDSKRANVDLIFKLYHYLSNLPPLRISENTTANTIISAENFQKNMRVVIKDKPMNYAQNLDEDKDNDVYLADLRFRLIAKPAAGNGDDLTIRITDENGYELAQGKIASATRSDGTVLLPDGEDYYTFSNIPLTEKSWKITVSMTGTQNLDRGVCLYTSEDRDGETSQIMVGVAEGPRSVNVEMALTLDFDIEDSVVERLRMWRSEVPVDSLPATGDSYNRILIIFALSGFVVVSALVLRRRKRAGAR